jgi:hypothetical protein
LSWSITHLPSSSFRRGGISASAVVSAVAAAFALVATLAPPRIAAAQERPDPTAIGNGPRAVGLSGAVTAVTDDIYSIGWNPAGLSFLERAEFAFVTRAVVFTSGAQGTTNNPTPTGFPRFSAQGEFAGGLDPVEFAGLAVPFKIGERTITAGVAYRWFSDALRLGNFRSRRREANGRFFSTVQYFNEGGTRAISPSIAAEITPRLRVGVTANILGGESVYRVQGPLTFRSELTERDHAGLAIETGAMFQVNDDLRIAAQITLPHERTMTIDNDTTQRDATRAAPLQVALGIAKRLNEKSTLSADARFAPWSSTEFTDDATGDVIPARIGVQDAASLHLGWERDVTNDIRRSAIRLGTYLRTTTYEDIKGKRVSAAGVSIGQSWYYEKITFEGGVQVGRSTRWTRSDNPATTTITLANTDFIVSLGLKRHF